MKVTMENFDKLDGFSPKSIFTFITRKVIVDVFSSPKIKLNRFDTIEFKHDKIGIYVYLWNGFSFKLLSSSQIMEGTT